MQKIAKRHHDYYKMAREILMWSFIITGFLLIVISFIIPVRAPQGILRYLGICLMPAGIVTLIRSRYAAYFSELLLRVSITATIKAPLMAILFILISSTSSAQPTIIDHNCTDITKIPQIAIEQAKNILHIAYGHTSHGSQLTTGMSGLIGFANSGGLDLSLPDDIFAWNNGGIGGALDLEEGDGYGSGWLDHDCGYYPNWVNETREYLDDPSHADVNVIIWSWCGQVSWRSEQEMIDMYLTPMGQLEAEYPHVIFVYMTGHADGTGESGNLHIRNQQIREYCIANGKVLFDFYDIDCYDPDGNYYGDKNVNDNCDYDSDGDGSLDANWATEWQNTHVEGYDWYDCASAHSQPLNANLKAYAAWWLWATLAGWNPSSTGSKAMPWIPLLLFGE